MLSQTLKTIFLFCSLFLCQAHKTIGDVLDENPKLYYYGDNCSPESFEIFKRTYNKQYNVSEEINKYATYCKNLDYIGNYNANPNNTIVLGMNQFGDLTHTEFRSLNSLTKFSTRDKNYTELEFNVPEQLDWRKKGVVTSVKDQGQCGSCWAFSAVASLESVNAIHGNHHLYNLSEQELVDCSTSYGNFGCGGGLMDNAFKFMMKSGVALYTEYPYDASDGSCNKSECKSMVNVTGYSDVPQNNETQLMMAVSKNPVSVAIDASDPTFQFYKSGVYNVSDCYNQLDHGVTAVGYGRDEVYNVDYWIVKNSWNVSWGNDGYIYMLRNYEQPEGMCGIAMDASYPLV